jgi:hypothetical protein
MYLHWIQIGVSMTIFNMAATIPPVQGEKNQEISRAERALILVQLVNLENVTAP